MSMTNNDNEEGWRKISDMTRIISLAVLLIHFYYFCHPAFYYWHFTAQIPDRILQNIGSTGLFSSVDKSKLISILALLISCMGEGNIRKGSSKYYLGFLYLGIGGLVFFLSSLIFLSDFQSLQVFLGYILLSLLGYALIWIRGTSMARIFRSRLNPSDIFNTSNETFPQEERFLENEYSINLPAAYKLRNERRNNWINIVNPFRGLLIVGSPGSGKSYFIIQHIIKQFLEKGFTMFIYDYKYDELSKITYNAFLKNKHKYAVEPKFYIINFDDLDYSHRCNPLDASSMGYITDATESAKTIMLALNPEWVKKHGDFWVESAISFLTSIIWFLRKYKDGKYCTLPHAIELMQVSYQKLFSILRTEPEIETLISPFVSAFENDVMKTLENQVATAKMPLARLASPQLYYILSGDDLNLEINNPENPKIVCLANNPQKANAYGPIVSLYTTTMSRVTNKKGKLPLCELYDEFTTMYIHNIEGKVATGRANKIAAVLSVQDASQLKLYYGKEQAEVIVNISGNMILGQAKGEIAKTFSESIGKIMQDSETFTTNTMGTTINRSKRLDWAVPVSRIASLSSGEFVGIVADNPDQKIELKAFCCEILNDHSALQKEQDNYESLPMNRKVTFQEVQENYLQIKKDIKSIIDTTIERMINDPALFGLIVN